VFAVKHSLYNGPQVWRAAAKAVLLPAYLHLPYCMFSLSALVDRFLLKRVKMAMHHSTGPSAVYAFLANLYYLYTQTHYPTPGMSLP